MAEHHPPVGAQPACAVPSASSAAEAARARDRSAVEHITGRPLPHDWPPAALPAGTRVTVVHAADRPGPWRDEFTGTIDTTGAPEPVTGPHATDGELAYWVAFDGPQYDSDGGGPYRKAQIWGRFLRPGPATIE